MLKSSLKDTFFRVFPAPRFLSTPAIGLDVSDTSVRFLELRQTRHGMRVGRYGTQKISPGLLVEGKILEPDKLAEELKAVREKNQLDFVNVALPEEQVYIFQTVVPAPPKGRELLRTIIESKLEENVPVSSSEAVFDFETLSIDEEGNYIVNVAVYSRAVVNDYVYVLQSAGFVPIAFEVEAQSIARSTLPHDEKTYMTVDFGSTRTGIAIVKGGALLFTSTIDVGGETLTGALKKHLNLDPHEIDKIKNEEGFAKYKNNEELFSSLIYTLSALKDEVEKRYTYWGTRANKEGRKESNIEKIILCGGSSNLVGLPQYLSSTIKVPIEIANVWRNVMPFKDHIPKVEQRRSLSYATSIGLSLRNFK